MKKIFTLLMLLMVTFTCATAAEAVTYTANAKSTYRGWDKDLGQNTVEVTDNGGGDYTLVYRQLTVGNFNLGDWTATDVRGTTANDGTVTLTFDGSATISNCDDRGAQMMGFKNGSTQSMRLQGTIKGKNLSLRVSVQVSGSEGVVQFGEETPDQPQGNWNIYYDKASCTYQGSVTNFPQNIVEVTDLGDGTYTVVYRQANVGTMSIGDLTASGVKGTTDEDGHVQLAYTGNATVSNSANMDAQDLGFTNGSEHDITLSGTVANGKLFLVLKVAVGDSEATFEFGQQSTNPQAGETVTYTSNAYEMYAGSYREMMDNVITVTDNGGGKYTFCYKQLTINDAVIADYTASDVTGYTDSKGITHYKFNGSAVLSNVDEFQTKMMSIYEGDRMPFNFEAESKDGKLFAQISTTYNRIAAVIYFGLRISSGDEQAIDSVYYRDKAVSYYLEGSNNIESSTVLVKDYGDGNYTFICYDLYANINPIGDYTAEGVKGVKEEDGSITYTFDGQATVSDVHRFGLQSGITEGSWQPFTIRATSRDGKLFATFTTTARTQPVTVEFGDNSTQQVKDTVNYVDKALVTYYIYGAQEVAESHVQTVKEEDGTYTFIFRQFPMPNGAYLADYTSKGVTGTENPDGSVNYAFTGDAVTTNLSDNAAMALTDGGTQPMTITGYSREGKLHATFATKLTISTLQRDLTVEFGDEMLGVSAVSAATDAPMEVYNLNGQRVQQPGHGVNIIRQGNRTYKVIRK